jgi:hypothetical protein
MQMLGTNCTAWNTIATYSVDTEYTLDVEVDNPNNRYRVKFNGGSYSGYENLCDNDDLRKVGFGSNTGSDTAIFIDNFAVGDYIGDYPPAGGGGSTTTVSLLYPTDSATVPSFSNWVMTIANLSPGEMYYGRVRYDNASTSSGYNDYFTVSSASTSSFTWTVPRDPSHLLYTNIQNQSTTYHWTSKVYLSTSSIFFSSVSSTQIAFGVNYTASRPSSTVGLLAGPFDDQSGRIASSSIACDSFWCNALDYLFVPSGQSMDFIKSSYLQSQDVFPFSLVFELTNDIQDQITGGVATSSLTLVANLGDNIHGYTTSSVSILTPTLMSDTLGSDVTNWWYNIVLMVVISLLLYEMWSFLYRTI